MENPFRILPIGIMLEVVVSHPNSETSSIKMLFQWPHDITAVVSMANVK